MLTTWVDTPSPVFQAELSISGSCPARGGVPSKQSLSQLDAACQGGWLGAPVDTALQPDLRGWVLWGFLPVTVLQDSGQLSVERGVEGCVAPVSLVWLDPQRLHTCSNQIWALRTCLVGLG